MNQKQRADLEAGAQALGISLNGEQIDQFARYAEMLEDWNQRLNLTRIPAEQVVPLQFLDSLAAARAVDLAAGRLIDVGTGAGFPGLPLRIAFPDLDVTLMDGTRKRLTFLDAVIEALGLKGVRTLHARAEDAAKLPAHRERYDVATARAVARLELLSEWLLPFVKMGGAALALKSEQVADEMAEAGKAVAELGGAPAALVEAALPGTDITRNLVVVRKERRTPARYPRPAAEVARTTKARR